MNGKTQTLIRNHIKVLMADLGLDKRKHEIRYIPPNIYIDVDCSSEEKQRFSDALLSSLRKDSRFILGEDKPSLKKEKYKSKSKKRI